MYAAGFCILYSTVCAGLYKLRVMSVGYRATRNAWFGWMIVTNVVVHAVTALFVIVQFATNPGAAVQSWVYVGYYWVALHLAIVGVATYVQAHALLNSVMRHGTHHSSALVRGLANCSGKMDGATLVTAVCLVLRAMALAADTMMPSFVTRGSLGEVLWNLVFKYALWIGPEIAVLVAFGVAMHYSEEMFKLLSSAQMRYKSDGGDGYQPVLSAVMDEYDQDPRTDNFGHKVETMDLEQMTGGPTRVDLGQRQEDVETAATTNSYLLLSDNQQNQA